MRVLKFLAIAVCFAMYVSFIPAADIAAAAERVSFLNESVSDNTEVSDESETITTTKKTTTKKSTTTTKKTTTKKSTTTTKKTTTKKSTTTTKKTTTKKSTTTKKTTTSTTNPKTTVTTTVKTTATEAPYMIGDIDNDKKITGSDATRILREYTLISSGLEGELTQIQKDACDVDGDGKITGSDATLTLAYYTYQGSGGVLDFEDYMKYGPIDIQTTTTAPPTTQLTTTTTTTALDTGTTTGETSTETETGTTTTTTAPPTTQSTTTTTTTALDTGTTTGETSTETETGTTTTTTAPSTTQSTTTTTTTALDTGTTTGETSTETGTGTTTTTTAPPYSDPDTVQEIKLSHYEVTIFVGGGDMALVTMYPETAPDKSEKWWSSDTSIATVNYEGWIIGIAPGECTVTVQSVNNPDVTAEIKVKVLSSTTTTATTTISDTTTTTTSDTTTTATTTSDSTTTTTTSITTTSTTSATTTTTNPDTVQEIKLSHYEVTIFVGGGDMALVTMYPETAPDKSEKWWSSDTSVATVNYEGWITGISAGECTVTVQSVNNPDVTAEIKVTVIENKVTEIKLDKYEVRIAVGKGDMPLVTMYPETAPDKSERWWSSDNSIATVNEEGWIVGVAVGECTVTVRSVNNPDVTAEIKVIVTDEGLVKEIVLDRYEVELTVGKGDMTLVTMLPADAEDKSEIWWSSDASVATVNYEGWIVGTGVGECIVTVQSAANPTIKAEIKVIVK
ncbi:MAG: Ig-like domain-containing protein [Ruminococcus sp.]|nr:Ig-like domain-containing protein [Ruminococcus sp.]